MSGGCVCIFGEVLFDHFPDGSRVLGGAPFNVAWHLQAFGQSPRFISRIGDDPEGAQICSAMAGWGMDQSSLQRDTRYRTGRVSVALKGGEPEYDIVAPCAYDAIDQAGLDAMHCRLLYHGSLALRHEKSRRALQALKAQAPETVFVDVNLRAPWWDRDTVLAAVGDAHWVKLNQAELDLLFPSSRGVEEQLQSFIRTFGLQGVVLTRGEQGATALTAGGEMLQVRPERSLTVVDTVGAGDAFASVVILGLMHGWSLSAILRRAQDFASLIVGNRGATLADRDFYQPLIEAWKLAD